MKNDTDRPVHAEPPKMDEVSLIAYLKTQPDIAAVYLFGSLATGRATSRSDIDIAVLLAHLPDDPMSALDRQLRLMNEIRRYVDREADVVLLNQASLILRHEVLAHGRLLYEANQLERVEFEVRTGREYEDARPVYDFFTAALFHEAKEGMLGNPRPRYRREAQSTSR